jgi:hypothetical protein
LAIRAGIARPPFEAMATTIHQPGGWEAERLQKSNAEKD